MIKFPQELTDSLAALSYIHLSKVPYDTKVPALRRESQKIMALRDWAHSHTEPIDGWMELYFSYFERMAIDIDPVRDSWTAYYELKGILRSLLFTMMRRQKQTRGSVLEFGKNLNDTLLLHRHGALISGYVMDMLVDHYDPLKTKFRFDDVAGEAMYEVYAIWIDTLFELAGKATSAVQIYRLKMAIYHLETEMRNIEYKEDSPFAVEPLMARILLFQLSVFDVKAFINQESFIEKIYGAGPLGEVELPEADKLLEEGVRQFNSHRKKAVLYLLLYNVLKALDVAANNSEDLRSHHSQGGNIGNVEGVSAFETFLSLLCIYTGEANLIANYLKQHISTNDQLFVIASVMGQDAYGVPSESENVKHRIVLALVDPHSESPQQIALKKLCIRWGLLDKYALPEKYRFNAPKKLPSTVQELVMFYKSLNISHVFRLGRGAPENSIPENFPDDIREIYMLFDGTPDDRHFAALSDVEEIRQDIMDTYGSDLEDADDEDPDTDDVSVDIREHIHSGIIPIGQNYSGDSYFADPHHLSITGHPVIVEYMHDEYLTGKLVANSLAEFLARHMIERFTEVNGKEKALTALLDTPIQIRS
ncbi:SMI1/KNR4 family protein [Flavobacterium sp.]|uniref:SMI1/KNR4 family protein n=1 Tax=Flavobacterium sp. TaxID=239 RepID=UPI00403489B7